MKKIEPVNAAEKLKALDGDLSGLGCGIYVGITNEQYHADKSCISSTGLKLALRPGGPALFRSRYIDQIPRAESKALQFGRAYHAAMEGPDALEQSYTLGPDVSKNSNKWKDAKKAAAAEGKELLDKKQLETIRGMVSVLHNTPRIKWLLSMPGVPEVTIVWQDSESGLWLKCRHDWLVTGGELGAVPFDYKSASDASPEAFRKKVFEYGYHISGELYRQGLNAITQGDGHLFGIIAQEKEAPYLCSLHKLSMEGDGEKTIIIARDAIRRGLELIASCAESESWPGYGEDFTTITPPYWVERQAEEEGIL